MKLDELDRAWIGLIALSCGSALVAATLRIGLDHTLVGILILFLALIKTRLILAHYLGLSRAPGWRYGFNVTLTLFCLLLLVLFLIPDLIA